MKFIIFLVATAITANLFGQDKQKETPTDDFKKVQIGVNFSPDYCFRLLKNNDGTSSSDLVIESRNGNETGKLGFTTGLNVIFNLKKNIGIEVGVQYSNKGYQTKMQDLTFGSIIDPRHGFVYNTSGKTPTRGKFVYNAYYIDIPLKVNYIIGNKRIRFISSAGVTTNIFIKETSKSILEYDDGTTDKNTQSTDNGYNKINVSPIVSVGIDWKFKSRANLRIEPTFRYGVLKIINAPVTGYLWNAGLNISYYLGLK